MYPLKIQLQAVQREQDYYRKIDRRYLIDSCRAKNFNDVVIVARTTNTNLIGNPQQTGAVTTREQRRWFCGEAFTVSSHYDTAIRDYFKK